MPPPASKKAAFTAEQKGVVAKMDTARRWLFKPLGVNGANEVHRLPQLQDPNWASNGIDNVLWENVWSKSI